MVKHMFSDMNSSNQMWRGLHPKAERLIKHKATKLKSFTLSQPISHSLVSFK